MAGNVNATTGEYGQDLFAESLYILAIVGAGQTVPAATLSHIRSAQVTDGGWEFSGGAGSDSNTTAMALQALLADHVARVPITIQALLGKGLLNVAGETYPLTPGTIVPVDAHVAHHVRADPALAILVTFFRQPETEAGNETTARFE